MKIKVCASGDLMLLDKLPQKYYAGGYTCNRYH